jgi:hypothetical protein
MVAGGGLTRYTFPTGSAACPANSLDREWVVPNADRVRALFEKFWTSQPRSLRQAQQWVDRYWNIATQARIEIDDDGLWFDQLPVEFRRILDHYASLGT